LWGIIHDIIVLNLGENEMKKSLLIIILLMLYGCQVLTPSFVLTDSIDSIFITHRTSYFISNQKNLYGLGYLNSMAVTEPTPIMTDVKHVVSLSNVTFALKNNGSLWEWGSSRLFSVQPNEKKDEMLRVLDDVKMIWGNESRLLYILKNDDSLWVLGQDDCRVNPRSNVESGSVHRLTKVLDEVKEVSVETFSGSAIARTLDGRWFIWGGSKDAIIDRNVLSLFFDQDVTCQSVPLEISFDYNIKHMVYAHQALLFITQENELYGLGNNHNFRINNSFETIIKTPFKIATDVKNVQTDVFSIYILKNDNALYRLENWRNTPTQGVDSVYLHQILSDVEVISSGVGSGSAIAITKNGTIYGWGNNQYNQLGGSQSKVLDKVTKIGQIKP
jgi:alpha-tubulin suppressor-like RCC1 family protein